MDEMRAMLDDLMGKDRNVPLEEREKQRPKKKHFQDKDVCKYYLCGFCPYEEFHRTKNDLGECLSVHDTECKKEWDDLPDKEKDRYGYERDLLRWLDRLLAELKRRIQSNTARVTTTQKPVFLKDDQVALDTLATQIEQLLSRAEKLGEEGEVDAAEVATTEAEALRRQREVILKQAKLRSNSAMNKNLVQSICPVSGLIINEEESRLRDHKLGRNYIAWKKLHEVHAALEEIVKKRRESRSRDDGDRRDHRERDSRGGRRHRSRSYERRRGRSRSRERERRRDRDRDRDQHPRGHNEEAGKVKELQSPVEEGEAPEIEEGEAGVQT